MQHRFAVGDTALAHTTATDHVVRLDGTIVTVDRTLGDDERDPEVGPMYEVTIRMHVFEDELTPTT